MSAIRLNHKEKNILTEGIRGGMDLAAALQNEIKANNF